MSPEAEPPSPSKEGPWLDAERMDCYQLALEFEAVVSKLLSQAPAHIRSQLQRASLSIVLNIAEGSGRGMAMDKARFYATARGSATECAAILDVLLRRQSITDSAHRKWRGRLVRIVQMLTKLEAVTRARVAHV